jgi:hypothetical protein
MSINPTTYATIATGTLVIPHGIGYAWATMLWEVYWNLIDKHGFNQNVYEPWHTGGNNLALQLVFDGMKLQPCGPGFVTGRNAILQADTLLTGGENQCAIWGGFRKRGLGFSASQGTVASVNDGVQAFDWPPTCAAAIAIRGYFEGTFTRGKDVTGALRVNNNAPEDGENLTWTMHEAVNDCAVPTDVPWLTATIDGTPVTAPGTGTLVNTAANLAGQPAGTYSALLCFNSNGGNVSKAIKFKLAR